MKKILSIVLLLIVLGVSVDNNIAHATLDEMPKMTKAFSVPFQQLK